MERLEMSGLSKGSAVAVGSARLNASIFLIGGLVAFAGACTHAEPEPVAYGQGAGGRQKALAVMVEEQIVRRGVRDAQVLAAMREVPRDLFMPEEMRPAAFQDGPLPIGSGQTISQPYIVAYMTEALRLNPADRVLEVGTGLGYQAAVLSKIVREVYTIEIVEPLAGRAREILKSLRYENVTVRTGDGYRGWPEKAPFDAIIVTAAPNHVPAALTDQLKLGGRLVMPLGEDWQELIRITRTEGGLKRETLLPVRFVPMTGEALKRPR